MNKQLVPDHYCMQEFKLHGVELQGPCATLASAGCNGKYSSNIQRDIMRKVVKQDPEQVHPVQKIGVS